jgi:putative phosphoribosyl transferase
VATFRDRVDAGVRLGDAIREQGWTPTLVMGLARGGVIVAGEVARTLGTPMDVVVARKLGAPGNPELGIGAVAPGVRVIDAWMVERLGVAPATVDAEVERQEREVDRRLRTYRGDRPPLDLAGGSVVVVDDGVATGVSARAALRWVRVEGAMRVAFAAPVGPPGACDLLGDECDDCLIVETPASLRAVGQWYDVFDQTTDDEVRAALEDAGARDGER